MQEEPVASPAAPSQKRKLGEGGVQRPPSNPPTAKKQKRSTADLRLKDYDAVLTDIEGTTTSISFVKEQLFPYVQSHVKQHLAATYEAEETQSDIADLRALAVQDLADKVPGAVAIPGTAEGNQAAVVEAVAESVSWQMSSDRKSTALKRLQGHMWRAAYEDGSIKGHVYPDVRKELEDWISQGLKIYIYSSGSIGAQKLLFKYSEEGDMLPLMSGHFDTTTGPKRKEASYKKIVERIGVPAERILFLTDILEEAQASKSAGVGAVLLLRPGNAPLPADHGFPLASSFPGIFTGSGQGVCTDKPEPAS